MAASLKRARAKRRVAVATEGTKARRFLMARLVRTLRSRLGWSQSKLARAISDDLDAGSVSRWERAILAPQATNCQNLVEFAQKHGWLDLAGGFSTTTGEWKNEVLNHDERAWLVEFEIILLNHEYAPDDGGIVSCMQLQRIVDLIHEAMQALKRGHVTGDKPVNITSEEQAMLWLDLIAAKKRTKKRSDGNGNRKKAKVARRR